MFEFLFFLVEYVIFIFAFILLFLKNKNQGNQSKTTEPVLKSLENTQIFQKQNSNPIIQEKVEIKEDPSPNRTPEIRTPETPVQNKKIEVVIDENVKENYLDQKIGQKERTILTSDTKRSSLSLKNRKRASQVIRGSVLDLLSSTEGLEAPSSSSFEELEEKTLRESFEKRMDDERKKTERDYAPKEDPTLIPITTKKSGPPPPLPTGLSNNNSNFPSGKVNVNQLTEMIGMLKKTKK